MGATEEEQRGHAEECEPVYKYVCIEGKGTVAHFHMDKNIAVHLVPLITIPNIVYMNVMLSMWTAKIWLGANKYIPLFLPLRHSPLPWEYFSLQEVSDLA